MPASTLPTFTPSVPLRPSRPSSPLSPLRRLRSPIALSTSSTPSSERPLPRPPRSPLSLLRIAVSTRSISNIPSLVRHCLPSALDVSLWRSAVSACLSARDLDSALIVLQLGVSSLPSANLHRSLLVAPLLAFARAARWRNLLDLLDHLHQRGPPAAPDERLLVSLANVAVEKKAYNASLALLHRVHTHGLKLGPVGYSVLLKSHGRARNVGEVRRTVALALAGPVPVDSVLLNSAVDALVRCDDLQAATGLVENDRYRPLVDVATFNTLIKGLARRGLVDRAFAVVDDMRDAGVSPNDVTRNTLLQGCVNAGDFDAAWRLADSVAETGKTVLPRGEAEGAEGAPQPPPQLTIALTSLVAGLAESGRVTDALALLGDMSRRNAPPSDITYSALIAACFRHGAVQEAMQVYEAITSPKLRTLGVVNAFVSGLCLAGDEKGLRLAADVVDGLLENSEGVKPNADAFNALLDGFMRAGMFERAEYFLKEMEVQGCRPTIVSFTIMMKGYADARMFPKAKKMFREISTRGIEPDRVALSAFVNTCARSGDTLSALRVLEYMERKGGALNPGVYSYTPLIVSYLRESDVNKAWGMYKRMRKNQVPLNVYLVELMTVHTVRLATAIVKGEKKRVSMDAVAVAGANLLRDAHEDGVDVKILRKCRRRMLNVFLDSKSKRHFRGLDYPEIRSASETIFEKHGWNDIDSGWRVI